MLGLNEVSVSVRSEFESAVDEADRFPIPGRRIAGQSVRRSRAHRRGCSSNEPAAARHDLNDDELGAAALARPRQRQSP